MLRLWNIDKYNKTEYNTDEVLYSMPIFGKKSKEQRNFLCKDLKRLVDEVIKVYDFSIICSHRDKTEQENAFETGRSKAHFGQSAHNYNPSWAVDCHPYPAPVKQVKGTIVMDDDSKEWETMVSLFKKKAKELGIDITCGADFKSFKDFPHIEISNWKEKVKDI